MSSVSLHNLRGVVLQFAEAQRRNGNPVSPGAETFMMAATAEIHKYLEDYRQRMSPSQEKGVFLWLRMLAHERIASDDVTDNTPIRRELPEAVKFRKLYKEDDLEPPSISPSPDQVNADYIKRMKCTNLLFCLYFIYLFFLFRFFLAAHCAGSAIVGIRSLDVLISAYSRGSGCLCASRRCGRSSRGLAH